MIEIIHSGSHVICTGLTMVLFFVLRAGSRSDGRLTLGIRSVAFALACVGSAVLISFAWVPVLGAMWSWAAGLTFMLIAAAAVLTFVVPRPYNVEHVRHLRCDSSGSAGEGDDHSAPGEDEGTRSGQGDG